MILMFRIIFLIFMVSLNFAYASRKLLRSPSKIDQFCKDGKNWECVNGRCWVSHYEENNKYCEKIMLEEAEDEFNIRR